MPELKLKSIIKESLIYAWRYKILWIFGMLVGAGMFVYDFSGGENWSGQTIGWNQVMANLQKLFEQPQLIGVVVLILLVLLISVLLSFLCRAALLFGVEQVKTGARPRFKTLLGFGWQKLLRIVLVEVVLNIINVLGVVLLFGYFFKVGQIRFDAVVIASIVVFSVYNFFVFLFRFFIYCFAVLEDQKTWLALRNGWQFFQQNIGAVLITRLAQIGLYLINILALIVLLLLCALPFVLLAVLTAVVGGESALTIVLFAGFVTLFVLMIIAQGFFNVFFYHYLAAIYWRLKQ